MPPPSRRPSAAKLAALTPDRARVARFTTDLDALAGPGRLGLAVSGGADSMALLLLAAAARPGEVEALSVDHGLRPEAAAEVEAVAGSCRTLGIPHHPLRIDLDPGGNVQARARAARYAAMAQAMERAGIDTLATAHHADDQAETLVMRLARGAGLSGLAGVRPAQPMAGMRVIRPLLGWRKAELEAICVEAGVAWARDPSNTDPRYDRTAARQMLAALDFDAALVAASAAHLAQAEQAIDWAVDAATDRLLIDGDSATLDAEDLPTEISRRLLLRAFDTLGAARPRGPDLERAMDSLGAGRPASLSGLLLRPLSAHRWHLSPEPPRQR